MNDYTEQEREAIRAKLREEIWLYERRKLSDAEADEMILEMESNDGPVP